MKELERLLAGYKRPEGYYWVRFFGDWIIAWWGTDRRGNTGWWIMDRDLRAPLQDEDLDGIDCREVKRADISVIEEWNKTRRSNKRLLIAGIIAMAISVAECIVFGLMKLK